MTVRSADTRHPPAPETHAVWPARRSTGGDAALWTGAALAVLALAILGVAATGEPGGGMLLGVALAFVIGLAAGAVGLWGFAYRRLSYNLTDTALDVTWFGRTLVVPYLAIDGVYTGQRLVGSATPTVPAWPGIYVGGGRARSVGRLRFFATSPDPAALTLIALEQVGLVVSARNPHEFRLALIERIQGAGLGGVAPGVRLRAESRAPWTALFDRWIVWSVLVALLLLFVTLALICGAYDSLPAQIPLRFDANGEPNLIGPKADLLRLPLFGGLVLLVDVIISVWVHVREPLLARLLSLGGSVVGALLLVAVVRLVQ